MANTYSPQAPFFFSFHSAMSGFFSYEPILWKEHGMTQNDLDMYKIKSIHRHTTYIPEAQNFVRVTLFSEKSTEWPQMTLTCSRSQIPTCMLHTPLRPIFLSVLLYDEPLLSYGPILGKVHQMTPNDLDMFKVKNTNIHVIYTPEAQIFIRFTLRSAVFELRPNFWKTAPNDPKCLWCVQGQKY